MRSIMLTKKEAQKNEVKTTKTPKPPTSQPAQKPTKPETAQPKFTKVATQTPQIEKTNEEHVNPYYASTEKKSHQKTRITVKYNVGYGNQLYIRGKGANLTWDRGIPLKNIKNDEWVWETDTSFSHCEFKVLINDRNYENGENHYLNQGASIIYTPHFYH